MEKFRCGFCGGLSSSKEGVCDFCKEYLEKVEKELSMNDKELSEKREMEDELAATY